MQIEKQDNKFILTISEDEATLFMECLTFTEAECTVLEVKADALLMYSILRKRFNELGLTF